MATLREHLCNHDNDYSNLEGQYGRITGAELVTAPLLSPEKGPERISKSASILIGSYNSRESLQKSLYSIEHSSFHQKYPEQLEIIVVDDGSNDDTRDMIRALDLTVPLKYVLQTHGGLTKAHRNGSAFAEGDVLIFSDSDVVHTRYALEELMKRHEILKNVTLAGFRFEVDPSDPRVSLTAICETLERLTPDFDSDFRLNFPGRPENICRETRHWKDYGFHRKIIMANGARYDLSAMLVGAFFSITRADYIRMGGSEPRLVGWGCEDSLIGARSIALGNFIIPVYSAASAHLSHARRISTQASEFQANIQTVAGILEEEFVVRSTTANSSDGVLESFLKAPSAAANAHPTTKTRHGGLDDDRDSFRRGCMDYALGRFDSSLKHFEMAIGRSPSSPWPRLGRGKALRELQDHEAAVKSFSDCLDLSAHNGWAHFELGLTHAAAAEYGRARQAMEAAQAADPGLFDANWALQTSSTEHKRRANFHAGEGLHRLAVRDFGLALTVDRTNVWAHFDLGLSSRRLGHTREALRSFQSTDELLHAEDANRTWVHTELGKTFADLGEINQAKLQLETAVRLFPENLQARTCLENLSSAAERQNTILCPLSIIRSVAGIEGWLTESEADLLLAAVLKAAQLKSGPSGLAVVEIGSFCGKSTIVIAGTLRALGQSSLRFYAIDPHQDYFLAGGRDTYLSLQENLRTHQLEEHVVVIREQSTSVVWDQPIGLLFVDGLHDYEYVKADYLHFRKAIADEGFVAFHDYADCCPGVQKFVSEILRANELQFVAQKERMVLFKKSKGQASHLV